MKSNKVTYYPRVWAASRAKIIYLEYLVLLGSEILCIGKIIARMKLSRSDSFESCKFRNAWKGRRREKNNFLLALPACLPRTVDQYWRIGPDMNFHFSTDFLFAENFATTPNDIHLRKIAIEFDGVRKENSLQALIDLNFISSVSKFRIFQRVCEQQKKVDF